MSDVLKLESGRRLNLESGLPVLLEGPDPYTKLLLHCNGANGSTIFTDSSPSGHTVTASGNAQISTTAPKFGSGCATFDGDGDFLDISDNVSDFRWGTADFTLDAWIKFAASISGEVVLFSSKGDGGLLFFDMYMASSGTLRVRDNGTGKNYSWSPLTDTWYHVQFGIGNGTDYFFVNGTRITGSGSWTDNGFNCYNGLYIGVSYGGNGYGGGRYFNGQMDEIRVSKGICRNTSNFTPPSSEYF